MVRRLAAALLLAALVATAALPAARLLDRTSRERGDPPARDRPVSPAAATEATVVAAHGAASGGGALGAGDSDAPDTLCDSRGDAGTRELASLVGPETGERATGRRMSQVARDSMPPAVPTRVSPSVSGTVRTGGGEVVPGAEIQVQPLRGPSHAEAGEPLPAVFALSDARGRFLVELPVCGKNWCLRVEHPEWSLGVLDLVDVTRDITVEVALEAGALVRGSVRTAGGATPAETTVFIAPQSPMRPLAGRRAAFSGDGRFAVAGLPPGAHTLIASAPGYVQASVPLLLELNAERTVEVVLHPTCRLAGFVLDRDGRPVSGAAVAARAPGGSEHGTVSAEDGAFELDRAGGSGPLRVLAYRSGYAPWEEAGIRVGGLPLEIVLDEAEDYAGIVLDAETGAPLAGARVRAEMDLDRPGLRRAARCVVTSGDGSFRLALATEQNGTLHIDAAGFLPGVFPLSGVAESPERVPCFTLAHGATELDPR